MLVIPCCTAKHLQGPGPVKIGSGPGGPLPQQQPPPPGAPQTRPQLSPNQQSAQGAPPPQRTSEQFIRGELQRLQQERARLQREQEEIARQVSLIAPSVRSFLELDCSVLKSQDSMKPFPFAFSLKCSSSVVRTSNSQLREPGFESCAVVSNLR